MDTADLVSHPFKYKGHRYTVANFASDGLINKALARDGMWEPWQLNLMERVIRDDFVCVDAGANIGINALYMAGKCGRGKVFAYEPFDRIHSVLSRNVRQNNLSNLVAVNKGLSSAARPMAMVADMSQVGGAHVAEGPLPGAPEAAGAAPETGGAAGGVAKGVFQFARLDEEMRGRGVDKIDFMKVDVEGYELHVLEGAGALLRNSDLQLVIEFNPAELRRAAPVRQPFFDRRLFSVLRSHFRHIFYMGRDNTLFELRDYHELRRCLLAGGFFVDDLYCTNYVRPEVSGLIVPRMPLPASVPVVHESRAFGTVTYLNRDADGWGMPDLQGPPVTFISVDGPPSAAWVVKLYPVYKKHLHRDGFVNWPVYALVGDVALSVDVLDSYRELCIDYTTGAPPILLESPLQVPASHYLGNPNDPRQVGFRCEVVSVETPRMG
jgi:FkbM family methyltransferase